MEKEVLQKNRLSEVKVDAAEAGAGDRYAGGGQHDARAATVGGSRRTEGDAGTERRNRADRRRGVDRLRRVPRSQTPQAACERRGAVGAVSAAADGNAPPAHPSSTASRRTAGCSEVSMAAQSLNRHWQESGIRRASPRCPTTSTALRWPGGRTTCGMPACPPGWRQEGNLPRWRAVRGLRQGAWPVWKRWGWQRSPRCCASHRAECRPRIGRGQLYPAGYYWTQPNQTRAAPVQVHPGQGPFTAGARGCPR